MSDLATTKPTDAAGDAAQGHHPGRVVEAFYQEVLGRRPDSGGLRDYVQLIETVGLEEAVVRMLSGFMKSGEFRALQAIRRGNSVADVGDKRLIAGRKVEHIASLGTHCQASSILKAAELKPYSLPFDWMYTSPAMIVHCLEDDFRTLLDRQQFQSTKAASGSSGACAHHRWYREHFGVNEVFAHRDPTNPGDLRYFERCIARLRRLLASDDGKLFVMISRPHIDLPASFASVARKIDEITRHAACLFIQLLPATGKPGCRSMRHLASIGEHRLYEFAPASAEVGVGFPDPLDNASVLQLVRQYSLDLKPRF